jgi:hypothetical protein
MSAQQQPSTLSLPAVPEAVAPRRADGPPANAVRTPPARLLFPSTQVDQGQTLTLADRERCRHAMRALRLAADRLEEALDGNRAAEALEASALGADAGLVAASVAALLGRKS